MKTKSKPDTRICMFTPGGTGWFDTHAKAVNSIRLNYPQATRVKRWSENCLQYEDYRDERGRVLCQLEFSGPPAPAVDGFTYE